jgi:hypothetical protein
VLVPEEKHAGAFVVQLVHHVEVWHLCHRKPSRWCEADSSPTSRASSQKGAQQLQGKGIMHPTQKDCITQYI